MREKTAGTAAGERLGESPLALGGPAGPELCSDREQSQGAEAAQGRSRLRRQDFAPVEAGVKPAEYGS